MAAELETPEKRIQVDYYFNRPAFAALLYSPLSRFSLPTATLIHLVLNYALLGLLVWKLPRWFPGLDPPRVRLFRLCLLVFVPFLRALGNGHDTLLLTLIVSGALYLAQQGRDLPAGVLLGAGVFKPHLLWALPIVLLLEGRRRMVGAFLVTGLALGAISLALVGVEGFAEWFEILRSPSTDFEPWRMANARGVGLQLGPAAGVAVAAVTLFSCLFVLFRGNTRERLSAAVVASLLLNYHTYTYDLSLLALAVSLTAQHPMLHYLLVLPWMHLYPRHDFVPLVLASALYVAVLAYQIHRRGRVDRTGPL